MKEKLQIVATQMLDPETENGPSSLLIVLGLPPREATVAYILNSRSQVVDLFSAIGPEVEDGYMQKVLTNIGHVESFPEESDEPGVVLEDETAQSALDTIMPDEEGDETPEEASEAEQSHLN